MIDRVSASGVITGLTLGIEPGADIQRQSGWGYTGLPVGSGVAAATPRVGVIYPVTGLNFDIVPGVDSPTIRQMSGWGHKYFVEATGGEVPDAFTAKRRTALVSGHNLGILPGSDPPTIRAMSGWGFPGLTTIAPSTDTTTLNRFVYRKARRLRARKRF